MRTSSFVLSFLCLLLFALAPSVLTAQRVRWEPPGGSLAIRQTSQLSLIFEDCEPQGEFTLPPIPHVTLGPPSRGEQSSVNIINGQLNRTRTIYYTYPIRPTEQATIRIPSFTVQTDRGALTVASAVFEVGEATVGSSSVPLDTAANSRLTVAQGQSVWAGQVVHIDYVLSVAGRFPASIASNPEWNPAPFVVEEWSRPEPGTALINGETRNTVAYRTRGYARQPGNHVLGAINQLVNLRVPSSGFSLFQAFQAEQYTIASNAPQVVVRPLPPSAPASFDGAVGSFQLRSRVVPEHAAVGEPITWTLELTGNGNWPDISGLPPREVSRDFRVVQPQAQRQQPEGQLFEGTLTEDVVLIPTRPGTYRLGPVAWSYFDPETGQYRTVQTDAVTLTIAPAAPLPVTPAADGAATQATPTAPSDETTLRPALPPGAPAAIPRDPLPDRAAAPLPWTTRTVLWSALSILGLVPLIWLGLAARRALQTDPGRHARAARFRLQAILRQLRGNVPPEQHTRLLHEWQQQTVVLWELRESVPASSAFHERPDWVQLWNEAERALYGAQRDLPADWVPRAEAALQQRRAPRFRPHSILRPANLLPLVVLAWLCLPGDARASDSGRAAYDRGDFAQAEAQWRDAGRSHADDWIAHHNLALALAQQQRWAEAAAHATRAFVQNPRDPSVRWHYTYAVSRGGFAPAPLDRFNHPRPQHRVAMMASPAEWQRLLLLAVALLAISAVFLLINGYFRRRALWPILAAVAALLAVTLGALAALSLRTYGPAANPQAVLIWRNTSLRSLPTDVPTDQQASTIHAGSIATVDHAFLGWRRLVFANGQTGWVRRDEFLPLWNLP